MNEEKMTGTQGIGTLEHFVLEFRTLTSISEEQ